MGEQKTTAEKALEINLDSGIYGTLAEFGARQEAGRWFFRVGLEVILDFLYPAAGAGAAFL